MPEARPRPRVYPSVAPADEGTQQIQPARRVCRCTSLRLLSTDGRLHDPKTANSRRRVIGHPLRRGGPPPPKRGPSQLLPIRRRVCERGRFEGAIARTRRNLLPNTCAGTFKARTRRARDFLTTKGSARSAWWFVSSWWCSGPLGPRHRPSSPLRAASYTRPSLPFGMMTKKSAAKWSDAMIRVILPRALGTPRSWAINRLSAPTRGTPPFGVIRADKTDRGF